mmetsp:Transcript_67832/g.191219  ORF Transcript_67832/g.191219 Transcript_67832/m.191219 type:complete len:399 (+) Transcript_67832:63-1259(+)
MAAAGGDAQECRPDPLTQELTRLRAANQAAAKENSRLRAEAADRQFDLQQLDKTVRKLERKIEALEDVQAKKCVVTKGFFKPVPADYSCPPVERKPPEKPKPKPWEKASGKAGVMIDAATGEELDPREYWPEEYDDSREQNILLRQGGHSMERELMREIQNPIETNPEFDTKAYTDLVAQQKHQEAEEMVKREGGPTLEQMQRKPLELLRAHPYLDANWCDPDMHGSSLLQWACSMGFDEVASALLQMRADANYKIRNGVSCLSSACAKNSTACARQLLSHRADPDEVVDPTGGQTLLMWASRIEYCDNDGKEYTNPFVSLLLESRVHADAIDSKGKTALVHASTEGNTPAVEALLAARADVDTEDKNGDTALTISLRYYHGKISSRLLPLRRKLPVA